MKIKILLLMGLLTLFGFAEAQKKNFFDFTVKDINGKDVPLKQYKGKRILVVNVASECGYTPQYSDLQKLWDTYKDSSFALLGFPCNDFGGQEPGTADEIKSFCKKNYGVTFPIMAKVVVKGDNPDPVYKWLQRRAENGVQDNDVKWNFNKFMVTEDGDWAGYVPSKVLPMDKVITDFIMHR